MTQPKQQIFEGVRVLDLVSRESGATFAGTYLADFGADVIKIDRPGDPGAVLGAHYVKNGIDLQYKVKGRNKRHVTLDITKPQGRDIFHKLVEKADVVIENFHAGDMEKWGYGWDVLSSTNPRLIFVRISDYGQDGPYKNRRLDGFAADAFCGFCHIDGERDGPPVDSQMDMCGHVAGMWAAMSIGIALYWRDVRGGRGQVIDMGLYEPLYRLIQTNITPYASTGKADMRYGNRRDNAIPWVDSHETKDGRHYSYSGATRATYRDTQLAMGMFRDPRFKDLPTAFVNREEFHQYAAAWAKERTLTEVDEAFFAFEGASAPCNNAEDLIDNAHIKARDLVVSLHDPDLGHVRMQGLVPKFSKAPGQVRWAGERPGARNAEVYGELLGLGPKELNELREAGVI